MIGAPIECKERFIVKLWKFFLLLIWLLASIYSTFIAPRTSLVVAISPFLWIAWVYGLAIFSVGDPNFTVSENGLQIKLLMKDYYLGWDKVISVRDDIFQSWVIVNELTILNRLIGFGIFSFYPAFHVGRWRKNYRPAMDLIRRKLYEKQIASQ